MACRKTAGEWLAARFIMKKRRALKFMTTIFTASAAGQQATVRILLQVFVVSTLSHSIAIGFCVIFRVIFFEMYVIFLLLGLQICSSNSFEILRKPPNEAISIASIICQKGK